jgi:cytosine/uracil/thiamine/allantoin permease
VVVSEVPSAVAERSPVQIGVFMALAALAFAALIGVIAVFDAGKPGAGFGTGAGIAFTIFVVGGTIACALACLVRGRSEILALGALAASGLAIDLVALAVWREIDDETYGKITAVASVWSFFGVVMLGLALAVHPREQLTRALFLGAMIAAAAAALIATWLIATAGGGQLGLSAPLGLEPSSEESLLRPLAAALVLLSALWFGALAASRLEQR